MPKSEKKPAAAPPAPGAESTAPKLVIRRVALADLKGDPTNAREHTDANISMIRSSLDEFAQVQPIVVQADGVTVIGGHGTLEAMRLEGWTHADVHVTPFEGAKAKKLGLVLNRSPELSKWNRDKLRQVVEEIERAELETDDLELRQLLGDGDSDESLIELKEWDADELTTHALFTFTAPLELQAKIRAVLTREFPGVRFTEDVIHE